MRFRQSHTYDKGIRVYNSPEVCKHTVKFTHDDVYVVSRPLKIIPRLDADSTKSILLHLIIISGIRNALLVLENWMEFIHT